MRLGTHARELFLRITVHRAERLYRLLAAKNVTSGARKAAAFARVAQKNDRLTARRRVLVTRKLFRVISRH